jgi:hypothetical protein
MEAKPQQMLAAVTVAGIQTRAIETVLSSDGLYAGYRPDRNLLVRKRLIQWFSR